jgi:hypothetical protein
MAERYEVTKVEIGAGHIEAAVVSKDRAHFVLTVRLESEGTRFVIRELSITADPSGDLFRGEKPRALEVDTALLRSIRLGAIRQAVVDFALATETGPLAGYIRANSPPEAKALYRTPAGRKALVGQSWKWTDDVLRAFAVEAILWSRCGKPGRLHDHLTSWAPSIGVDDLTPTKARDVLHKVRRAGYLADAKQGTKDPQPGWAFDEADLAAIEVAVSERIKAQRPGELPPTTDPEEQDQ